MLDVTPSTPVRRQALATFVVGSVLLLSFAVFGCGAEQEPPGSAGDQSVSSSTSDSSSTSVTRSLPPYASSPPTAFYDPPLDLSGLIGRPASDATAWAEGQGFTDITVSGPNDGVDGKSDPGRLVISVDGSGVVTRVDQG